MNQVDGLEALKTIKRRARLMYHCSRAIYGHKLSTSSSEKKMVFYEAINALDAMYRIYEQLKTRMRRESTHEQIKFAGMWDAYLSCIDTMTAYRANDKYLLSYMTIIDESMAKKTALRIWHDYNKLIERRKSSKAR